MQKYMTLMLILLVLNSQAFSTPYFNTLKNSFELANKPITYFDIQGKHFIGICVDSNKKESPYLSTLSGRKIIVPATKNLGPLLPGQQKIDYQIYAKSWGKLSTRQPENLVDYKKYYLALIENKSDWQYLDQIGARFSSAFIDENMIASSSFIKDREEFLWTIGNETKPLSLIFRRFNHTWIKLDSHFIYSKQILQYDLINPDFQFIPMKRNQKLTRYCYYWIEL
jgi:hypothetical protein